METLLTRLAKTEFRMPKLKKIKSMSLEEFIGALRAEVKKIDSEALKQELRLLLDKSELAGLDLKMKAALNKLIENLAP